MGIIEWLQVWLIVNALFVVWRILVVSNEPRDRSAHRERIGQPTASAEFANALPNEGADQQE